MKLKDIYSLPPIHVYHNFNWAFRAIEDLACINCGKTVYKLAAFCDLISDHIYSVDEKIDRERFQINMYLDEGDDKYGARLYTVVFDGIPIMMVKNDGRYYDNYSAYLSNENQLYALTEYISSLLDVELEENKVDVVSEDQDIPHLTQVNDYELFDYYDANLNPKYKKGDEVWAWVLEDHFKSDYSENYQGYVLTKVRIHDVQRFNPIDTYHGSQLERGWSNDKNFPHTMRLFQDGEKGGGMGCNFNDILIVGEVGKIAEPAMAVNKFVDSNGYLPKSYKMDIESIIRLKLK